MPKRTDLKRILIIGSGPIVIGQACEFDYSGTQGCRALREEGFEVVLVNSNPATIMTDPELADRTYIEPLTPESVAKIIERERPQALLPTLGGQTALNIAVALAEDGTLARLDVESASGWRCPAPGTPGTSTRRAPSRRRSASPRSSVPPSPSAAPAARSPIRPRSSRARCGGACRCPRSARCWSSSP